MFEFKLSAIDDVVLLTLEGRLDAIGAPELRPAIDQLVAERQPKVICDVGGLTSIDSSGVGAIVSLFKRLRVHGGNMRLAGLAGQPKEIFRLLRLHHALDLFDSVEHARDKF